MPDQFEQELLEKYCPWLYYDTGETFWPCSATWFVERSALINNPGGDIDQPTVESNPRIILQAVSPRCDPVKLNLIDDFQHGQYANNPTLSVEVPLYGHAVPLSTVTPKSSLSNSGLTFGEGWILLQYWCLFGYNDTGKWDSICPPNTGDHEGDICWLDLLLSATNYAPQYVIFHHHGDSTLVPWAQVELRDGAPIAYLEKGCHELREAAGGETASLLDPTHSHDGAGVRYRPSAVINMGEVDKPIRQANADTQLDAELFLLYEGQWGDFTGPGCFAGVTGVDITNPDAPVNQEFPNPFRPLIGIASWNLSTVAWGKIVGNTNATFPLCKSEVATVTSYEGPSITNYAVTAATAYESWFSGGLWTFKAAFNDHIPACPCGIGPSTAHNLDIVITNQVPCAYSVSGNYDSTWLSAQSEMSLVAQTTGPAPAFASQQRLTLGNAPGPLSLNLETGLEYGALSGILPSGIWDFTFGASVSHGTTPDTDSIETGSFILTLRPLQQPVAVHLSDIQILKSGAVQFSFSNSPGATFTVLATSDASLPVSSWKILGVTAEVDCGQFQFTDEQATNSTQRFYLVRSP